MPIGFLCVTGDGHAPPEEGDVPEVGEGDAGPGVDAEDLDGGDGGDDPHPEADHVGQRGDGDGGGCVGVGLGQSLRHRLAKYM